ncbi:MAG: hypothetical protein KDD62_13805, partial [Bdellovibrionales bacterium]|nr:hypothetical protein [Bdellovibrionales bacterium]
MDRAQLIEDIQVHFPLYVVTFFLASCSILYELIVAQTLSLLAANTVIWYSVTVGLFLLGMGLGSLLSKLLGTQGRTLKTLVTVEVLLSLVGLLMVPYLHVAHMLFSSFAAYNETLVGIAFFFIGGVSGALVIGILTGIELPLLIRIREENAKLKRDGTHVVNGIDYVGSLLGAVAFPLVLVPHLDLMVIAALVSSVNAIIAIVLIAKFMHTRSSVLIQGVTSVTILIGAAAVITHVDRIEQYFLKKYYHYLEASDSFAALFAPMPNYPTVYRHSSAYQKIDLVEDPSQSTADLIISAFSDKFEAKPDFPKKEFLFLNGDFQMTSSHEEIYHEYFAHVPIQMHGSIPRKILVLGGGDGILIRELIKYPEVSVRQIDLDPVLINLAKTDPILTAINENSL